jgi:hypothetical protein
VPFCIKRSFVRYKIGFSTSIYAVLLNKIRTWPNIAGSSQYGSTVRAAVLHAVSSSVRKFPLPLELAQNLKRPMELTGLGAISKTVQSISYFLPVFPPFSDRTFV